VVRGIVPDSIVIAAAENPSTVTRIRRAGADFCFSVGQVSAELIRFQLLGEHSVSLQPQIKIVEARAGALAGSTVVAGDIRRRTGCSIVAVERDGALQLDLESLVLAADDAVYVTGTQESIDRYKALFHA
jgi:Trk K+ transport system NAD-binding subunit